MPAKQTLNQYLESWSDGAAERESIAAIIQAIANGGCRLARAISRQGLDTTHDASSRYNDGADTENTLNHYANDLFEAAFRQAPVRTLVTAGKSEMLNLDRDGSLVVALEPLDNVTSVEANLSPGSLFSIFDVREGDLLQRPLGEIQKAAGILQYGPGTRLLLSCGEGTEVFMLDPITKLFIHTGFQHRIPHGEGELAINTSNYRHWNHSIRYFIDDCISGTNGPFGIDFDLRWIESLVAEACRVLVSGGIFLAPSDSRSGRAQGQTRLLFEAAPLAMLVEQAGGSASDGRGRILDLEAGSPERTVPLILGTSKLVETVVDYVSGVSADNTHFPLFENRSLLRN